MREVINTTVFDTEDIMAYIEAVGKPADAKKRIKIRYLAKPKKDGYGRDVPQFWAWVESHQYDDLPMEIAILRPSKWIDEHPLIALAKAADDDDGFVPDRVVADLVVRLVKEFYRYTRNSDEVKKRLLALGQKIRVLSKEPEADKNISALRSLRTKARRQRDHIEHLKRRIIDLPGEIADLEKELRGCKSSLPNAEEYLKKINSKIYKREKKKKELECTSPTDSPS